MAVALSSLQPYVQTSDHAVYVRRRLVAVLLLVTMACAGVLLVQKIAAALPDVPASVGERGLEAAAQPGDTLAGVAAGQPYVVQPGDTLWSIATRLDPTGNTASLVDRLADLNGGVSLAIGQRLVLPRP